MSAQEVSGTDECGEHKEMYIAYCIDPCKKPICVSCMANHVGHKLLNHQSLAEYVKQDVDSSVLPLITAATAECTARVQQVTDLPLQIDTEIQALANLLQTLSAVVLAQKEKLKEPLAQVKANCEQELKTATQTTLAIS